MVFQVHHSFGKVHFFCEGTSIVCLFFTIYMYGACCKWLSAVYIKIRCFNHDVPIIPAGQFTVKTFKMFKRKKGSTDIPGNFLFKEVKNQSPVLFNTAYWRKENPSVYFSLLCFLGLIKCRLFHINVRNEMSELQVLQIFLSPSSQT